jgi:hypothetical protein
MTPILHAILVGALAISGSPSMHGRISLEETYQSLVARREVQLARLHEYADRGLFPLNKDFPGKLVPYFVDEAGTACAVGHLMRLDGECDPVATIASTTNHIRIENMHDGRLLDWIRDSGLTKEECALIQPSYATIEDYRRGREWKDEVARLQAHFANVEKTLVDQSQLSLRMALVAKVDVQHSEHPDDPAFTINALSKDLHSKEPNVRIAAAHAIAQISEPSRSARLSALEPNLSDSDREVRFWTAIAIHEIGAASSRGEMELYSRTLPVFLDVSQNSQHGLRQAALIQLANIAPMTMGSNRQLRIMPEIRQTFVQACDDEDSDIRQFALSVLRSWRWQRIAYESQRILRQYLAESADLESLATETLALGREASAPIETIESFVESRSVYDTPVSIIYLLPIATEKSLPVAATADEAKQLVDNYFTTTYEQYRDGNDSPWPFWEIVSADTDKQELYYIVVVVRKDTKHSHRLIYVVPRPSMLSNASSLPYYWFERIDSPESNAGAGKQHVTYIPNQDAEAVLGKVARNDLHAFAAACDVFAYFLTHHSQLLIDREVRESADSFVWTGRFARLRANNPRFFGEGMGPSTFSGSGWDFHRLSFECDRMSGRLQFLAEREEYPLSQLPPGILSPEWVAQEHELMGWKPLKSIDFFGDEPLPPEYHEAIDAFKPEDARQARNMLYRRHTIERCLPSAELMLGLLYGRAGRREEAVRHMKMAAERGRRSPDALASVARWKLGVGLHEEARSHADAALALWPEHPQANDVIRRLGESAPAQLIE